MVRFSRCARALPVLALLSCVASGVVAQSATVVNIPQRLQGMYTLEMVNATGASPIQNTDPTLPSDDILLYVSPYGELCTRSRNSSSVQLLSNQPVLQGGILGAVRWDVAAYDLSFTLNINQDPFTGFDLKSLDGGSALGRMQGSAPSYDTGSCSAASSSASSAINPNVFFSAAETAFPSLFPSSAFSFNQIGSGFDVFRYYKGSEVYLAVRDGVAYARGGYFGEAFSELGELDDLVANITSMPAPNRAPALFQGTFVLTLSDTRSYSPIAEGTQLTFVVTKTGQLCVGELEPIFPVVSGTNLIWNHPNANLRYAVDLTLDDDPDEYDANFAVGEFFLQSSDGASYGLFEGDKVSLSTECADAKAPDPDKAQIDTLFYLLEQQYPLLFPAGPQTYTQRSDGYSYRYYFESRIFVAVKKGLVYVNGGQFGSHEEPVEYGSLSALLTQLNNTPTPATLPASAAGTYAMAFASASSFAPPSFADGTSAQVVMDAAGNLCLDGVSMGQAVSKVASPNRVFWDNADAGLSISLDLSTLSVTGASLQLSSLSGLAYSSLSGSRSSLATSCGGSSQSLLDMAAADQLFGLAEQHYASLFPASRLSFNQIEGNSVRRYYPASGMTLSMVGDAVRVKGGSYGDAFVAVGNVSALISQIIAENAPVYDLVVTGRGTVTMASTPAQYPKVDIKRYSVVRPDSADTVALKALVASSLSKELTKIDSITLSDISDSASSLTFTAVVLSDSAFVGATTTRSYTLSYTLLRR